MTDIAANVEGFHSTTFGGDHLCSYRVHAYPIATQAMDLMYSDEFYIFFKKKQLFLSSSSLRSNKASVAAKFVTLNKRLNQHFSKL